MTVRSILDSKGYHVESVDPSTKLSVAIKTMADKRIGAVIVLNESGGIAGILSERDVVRVLAEHGEAWLAQPVKKVMTNKVVTCTPSATVSWVMEQMTSGKFRHVPVLNDDRLVGIISIGDVVKFRLSEIERESEALREYIKSA